MRDIHRSLVAVVEAIYKVEQRKDRNCLAHSADDIDALLAASATIVTSGSTG